MEGKIQEIAAKVLEKHSRWESAKRHYFASCQTLAVRRNTTKDFIHKFIKESMKVKSVKDIREEELRELAAALDAQAHEE